MWLRSLSLGGNRMWHKQRQTEETNTRIQRGEVIFRRHKRTQECARMGNDTLWWSLSMKASIAGKHTHNHSMTRARCSLKEGEKKEREINKRTREGEKKLYQCSWWLIETQLLPQKLDENCSLAKGHSLSVFCLHTHRRERERKC